MVSRSLLSNPPFALAISSRSDVFAYFLFPLSSFPFFPPPPHLASLSIPQLERVRSNQSGVQSKVFKRSQAVEALRDPAVYILFILQVLNCLTSGGGKLQIIPPRVSFFSTVIYPLTSYSPRLFVEPLLEFLPSPLLSVLPTLRHRLLSLLAILTSCCLRSAYPSVVRVLDDSSSVPLNSSGCRHGQLQPLTLDASLRMREPL
jgi:hypothetical protein